MTKSYCWVFLIMSDKSKAENYTKIALKNFQCSISFCNIEFQSSCDFSVEFSATNFHSENAHQASDLRLLRSLEPDATMEPRYLKFDTWLIESTWMAGWGLQFTVIYSVFGALMTRPRLAAVLVSWACAQEMEDSSKAMSSAKSRSFNDLAWCRLERRGWVTTPDSSCGVAFFSAFWVFVKHTNSIDYSFWNPIVSKNCKRDFPVDGIKGFFEVNKGDNKR